MNYFEEHLCGLKLPLITIYEKPSDFPDQFAARLFNIDKATSFVIAASSLEEIRKTIPWHMSKIARSPDDDPCIVEVYI